MFIPEYEKKDEKQNYHSNLRLVISGTCFEFYEFSEPIWYGRRLRRIKDNDSSVKMKFPLSSEEKLLSSSRRAKRNISRLIKTNAFKWYKENEKPYMPITLTLTFSDEIRDVEKANNLFSNFIQRLNYNVNLVERKFSKQEAKKNLLKYSAVIEFQDKTRNGVVHYHMIFYNLPRMNKIYDRLTKIWGKGYFWVGTKSKYRKKGYSSINDSKRLSKIVEYFTKYISKSFNDPRLRNKKKYFNSRGLIKPIEIEIEELVELIKKKVPIESLVYGADELKYKYKLREKSFNYHRFDLANYPDELAEAIKLVNSYY